MPYLPSFVIFTAIVITRYIVGDRRLIDSLIVAIIVFVAHKDSRAERNAFV